MRKKRGVTRVFRWSREGEVVDGGRVAEFWRKEEGIGV